MEKFNDDVPLSLGIDKDRAEVIQKFTHSIVRSQHSDVDRICKIKEAFPRFEENVYAIYLLIPTKQQVAVELVIEDGTDMM